MKLFVKVGLLHSVSRKTAAAVAAAAEPVLVIDLHLYILGYIIALHSLQGITHKYTQLHTCTHTRTQTHTHTHTQLYTRIYVYLYRAYRVKCCTITLLADEYVWVNN